MEVATRSAVVGSMECLGITFVSLLVCRGRLPPRTMCVVLIMVLMPLAMGDRQHAPGRKAFGGSYKTIEGDPPPGFKYPWGKPKPSVVQ